MLADTLHSRQIEFEAMRSRMFTRTSIALAVYWLRRALVVILFLLIMFTTRFLFMELFGPSAELDRIKSAVTQGTAQTALISADSSEEPSAEQLRAQFSRKDARIIGDTTLFGVENKVVDNAPAAVPTKPDGPVETPLPFALIGTFVSPGDNSVAIIEEEKKKSQEVFGIGEQVFELAVLKSVHSSYIELDRDGKIERLTLDQESAGGGGGAAPSGAEEIVVDETELNTALENLPLLLTQARAVPYFKEGKSVGLRLFAIKTGSLYDKIGLKNGDILSTIDGKNLGDFSQAMKLFEQLKEQKNLTLQLERNRKPTTYYYTIQ